MEKPKNRKVAASGAIEVERLHHRIHLRIAFFTT